MSVKESHIQRQSHWRSVLQAVEQSGLSGAEYCRQKDIKYSQLADWRRRFRKTDSEAGATTRNRDRNSEKKRVREKKKQEQSTAFARVEIAEGSHYVAQTPSLASERKHDYVLDIKLPSGGTIGVRATCSPELLKAALSKLGDGSD